MTEKPTGDDADSTRPTELLDVIDPATGAAIGQADRSEVHRQGKWHHVFHCLIVRPGHGTVILQERAPTKASFAGKLDLSATGHLETGESPIEGLREVREELGIDIAAERLVPLGTRLLADNGGEASNRERMHVFLCDDDRPLDRYRPDTDEVSALVEVDAVDLLACFADTSLVVGTTRWVPDTPPQPHSLTVDDLVPAVDGYWIVLLVMTLRHLRGEGPLAI